MPAAPVPSMSAPAERTTPASTAWPVQRTFPVVYASIDALRHLNHAAYFPFMETLRCDYYLPIAGLHDVAELDIIVAEATCRYLLPVVYGDVLRGEVAPARPPGRTSFALLYRFTSPDRTKLYARGRTVVVCYDYPSARKKEIPAPVRQRLERDAVDPVSEGW
jgi:acyl-CoA thioester hydrolase